MGLTSQPRESCRATDVARLAVTKLQISDGLALESIFRSVTEIAAEVLEVERVGVWLLVEGRRALRCVDLYECSKRMHSAGATLQTDEFPDYFAAIERRKTVPAEDARADPRTSQLDEAYLRPLGITSMLDAPIHVNGEVVGILCHEHLGPPCEWTTEQRDFAGSMADLLAMKMQAAEAEELRSTLRSQANELAEARRVRALAGTVAGIAHDFNNILSIMVGAAELIASEPDATDEVVELAKRIVNVGMRGEALGRGLIEYAEPSRRISRVVRPAEVVAGQLDLLQAAAGDDHCVQVEVRSTAGRVLIDPHQLERVLLNLIVNARDAMPGGGDIRVVIDNGSATDNGEQYDEFVVIAVVDQGCGIPPEVLNRVFDPFFTTKPKGQGTGVGLAVVKQVIDYAGGFVRVESAVEEGTTVKVYLPRVSCC